MSLILKHFMFIEICSAVLISRVKRVQGVKLTVQHKNSNMVHSGGVSYGDPSLLNFLVNMQKHLF